MRRLSIENGMSVRRTSGCGPTGVAHQVVAVQRDVERPDRHVDASDLLEARRKPLRERHAARADAREREFFDAAVALDDFMRNTRKRARHALAVYDNGHDDLRLL